MPNRSSKRPRDINQLAKLVTGIATGQVELPKTDDGKNPAAVALGRKGGLIGGLKRAENLSPKKRSQIARTAAKARWGNRDEGDKG
jgi:hypothetical protein